MFDNIGGKIKGVAKLVTWLGLIASAVGFMIFVGNEDTVGLAFAVLIIGGVGSWLSSLTLYGFGQLIENSDIIVSKISSGDTKTIVSANSQSVIQKNGVSTDTRSLEELLDALNLTAKQKSDIEELREWEKEGLITSDDCKSRISKLLSDKPLELVISFINKI